MARSGAARDGIWCAFPSAQAENKQTQKEKIMNTIQIDQTMTATTTMVVDIEDLKKIVAPLDEWSYETFLLKNGSD